MIINKKNIKAGPRSFMTLLELPFGNYEQLVKDYEIAQHVIDAIDIDEPELARGFNIYSLDQYDSLMAVQLLLKKIHDRKKAEYNIRRGREFFDESGELTNLPIVSMDEFERVYEHGGSDFDIDFSGDFSLDLFIEKRKENDRTPYWYYSDVPLIIERDRYHSDFDLELLERANRLVFIISANSRMTVNRNFRPRMSNFDKKLRFEQKIDTQFIAKGEIDYYQKLLKKLITSYGYKAGKDLDPGQLIQELMDFRKFDFEGYRDVQRLVELVTDRKKQGSSLSPEDFIQELKVYSQDGDGEDFESEVELKKLIGLDEVKRQLERVSSQMKLLQEKQKQSNDRRGDKRRKQSAMNNALVFMGNPGVGKSNVAQIFAKMLEEKGVTMHSNFVEASRRDLVGRFVGWTAHAVSEVFEAAEGGVLFIDEAYSLMGYEGKRDNFAEEALTEIIAHMENNPDTVVIFAGYVKEMQEFVNNSNAGMKSRISHIIEFPDYSPEELVQIFHYQLAEYDFNLAEDEREAVEAVILEGLEKLVAKQGRDLGNGRLMRKLVKLGSEYMSYRENDLFTMTLADIESAMSDLVRVESLTRSDLDRKAVGFLND